MGVRSNRLITLCNGSIALGHGVRQLLPQLLLNAGWSAHDAVLRP
jgi:hypothetical protein